ncbi:hypothetical protein VN97_g8325 [Penicillium thymicola]|uniref:Uncharacterized protein n=1 Tax=Penicillium thymicola TaxID=293382 RepID=A0AAI9TDJ4_PENTH|nr:hypothetical protein VN97_g8325 [Penicillium thymicola]
MTAAQLDARTYRHKRLVSGVSGATPLSFKLRERGGTSILILFNHFTLIHATTATPTRMLHELNNPNQSQILKATSP